MAQYLAAWSGGSSTNFTLAYNYNETEVTDTTLVNGVDPISDQTIFNIEENLPNHRASLSVFHDMDRWYIVGRVHYYGKHYDERGPRDKVDATTFVDLEAGWNATDNFTFVLGAANVFDEYPNEIDTRRSQGLPYPRRTAMGYDGGMYYLRGIYRW